MSGAGGGAGMSGAGGGAGMSGAGRRRGRGYRRRRRLRHPGSELRARRLGSVRARRGARAGAGCLFRLDRFHHRLGHLLVRRAEDVRPRPRERQDVRRHLLVARHRAVLELLHHRLLLRLPLGVDQRDPDVLGHVVHGDELARDRRYREFRRVRAALRRPRLRLRGQNLGLLVIPNDLHRRLPLGRDRRTRVRRGGASGDPVGDHRRSSSSMATAAGRKRQPPTRAPPPRARPPVHRPPW